MSKMKTNEKKKTNQTDKQHQKKIMKIINPQMFCAAHQVQW